MMNRMLWSIGLTFFICTIGIGTEQKKFVQTALRIIASGDVETDPRHAVKCGTSLVALVHADWSGLSSVAKSELSGLLVRPERQTSRLSPSKRFRVHYDTSGVHTPAMITSTGIPMQKPGTHEQYVDSVAAIFDQVWRLQVEQLGYAPPPSDNGQGGGNEYDIYIGDLGTGTFGQTSWTLNDAIPGGPTQRYSTFIEVDNDYLGYRTPGLNGLRVTAAHEFHHAVQIGTTGIWSTVPRYDFYFYELSAVWMEDVVFDDVNDYLFDLPSFFHGFRELQTQRSYPFTSYGLATYFGYERSVFAHFLARRFGTDVMREIWEGMRSVPVLATLERVLKTKGADLATEFALFGVWNFYTADRADTLRYYPEGHLYPRLLPNITSSYTGTTTMVASSAYPLSLQSVQFHLSSDTITATVANVEASAAMSSESNPRPYEIVLTAGHTSHASQRLGKGMTAGFSGDARSWRVMYLESSTRRNASIAAEVAPNPLRLHETSRLTLPLGDVSSLDAEVFFLDGSLDLTYSGRYPIVDSFGKKVIIVPSNDLLPELSTGIYFVIARCGDEEFRWKVAVLK